MKAFGAKHTFWLGFRGWLCRDGLSFYILVVKLSIIIQDCCKAFDSLETALLSLLFMNPFVSGHSPTIGNTKRVSDRTCDDSQLFRIVWCSRIVLAP